MTNDRNTSGDTTLVTGGKHQESVPSLVSDCRLMLLYARKNGMIVPESLLREISWLDGVLKARSRDSISGLDPALITSVSGDAPLYLPDGPPGTISQMVVPDAAPLAATTAAPRISPTPSPTAVPPAVDPPRANAAAQSDSTLIDPPATPLASAAASQAEPKVAASTAPSPEPQPPVVGLPLGPESPPDATLPVEPSSSAASAPENQAAPHRVVDAAPPPDPVPPLVQAPPTPASALAPTNSDLSTATSVGVAASPDPMRGTADNTSMPDPQPKSDVSGQPPPTDITPAAAAKPKLGLNPEEAILDVHSQLSVLIAPTTALSLQASEPPPGQYRIFGGMPALVKVVIIVAAVSALCFVVSSGVIATHASKVKQAAAEAAASAPDAASAPKGAGKVVNASSEPIAADANSTKPAVAPPPARTDSAVPLHQPAASSNNLQKQPQGGLKETS